MAPRSGGLALRSRKVLGVFVNMIRVALLVGVAALCAGMAACGNKSDSELIQSAKKYIEQDKSDSAAIELKSALDINPDSGEARHLLAVILLKKGDPAGAIVELEKALAGPSAKKLENEAIPQLATALLASGQAKKVTDRFAQMTLPDPKANAELLSLVASGHFAQGRLDAGEAAVLSALTSDPKNIAARMLKARLLAGGGRGGNSTPSGIESALNLVETIIAEVPARVDALQLKGDLLWVAKSDLPGAVQAYKKALALNEKFLPAHLSLIRLAIQQSNADEARKLIAAFTKAFPGHPEALYFDTQLALADQDIKRAREGAQQLLRFAPENAQVQQLAGAVEFQAGTLRLAENHFGKALQLQPELPAARRMLAEVHLRAGQPTKALLVLKPLLEQGKANAATLAAVAEAHLQNGDMALAEQFFGRASKSSPDDPKLKVALALTEVAKGNVDSGLIQLDSLAAADKGTYADLALITTRIKRNDLNEALKAADRLVAKIPDKPMPYLVRGRVQLFRKDLAAARANYERALSVSPTFFPAISELASLDVNERKHADALKRYEEYLGREPNNPQALLAVASLKQSTGAKPDQITALLTAGVKANQTDAPLRLALVDHLLAQTGQAKQALAAAQEAVAALPEDMPLLDALGRSQLANGESQQAIVSFKKVSVAQPSATGPLLRLADVYMVTKDFVSARQSLQSALRLAPDLFVAHKRLVMVALADKNFDEALGVAQRLQRQYPKSAAGFLLEGEIRKGQQKWDPAIAAVRGALERSKSADVAIKLHGMYLSAGRADEASTFATNWLRARPDDVPFLLHMGLQAMGSKDNASAEIRYRQVLAKDNSNVVALNNLASVLISQRKPGSVPLAERANQLSPGEPLILDTLASAYAADGNLKKAIETQKEAVARGENIPGLRLSLAKLSIRDGDSAQARSELEKLSALGAKFSGHAEVAELLKKL